MEDRLKELKPYLRRLRHMYHLNPVHEKIIDEKPKVVPVHKDEPAQK